MAVGDVWRVVVRYSRSGKPPAINQFHYVIDADPAGATMGQIAASINIHLVPALRVTQISTITLVHFTLQHVNAPILPVENTFVLNLAGTRAGSNINLNIASICGIISRKTGIPGQKYRGRVFIPYTLDADHIFTGVVSGGYMTMLQTLATQLQLALPTGAGMLPVGTMMVPCLFHLPGKTFTRITQHVAKDYVAHQRRRIGDRWP